MKTGPVGGVSEGVIGLLGKVFSRWTVLEYAGTKGKAYAAHYLCVCECGTRREVKKEYLLKGKSRSCGCLHRQIVGDQFRTHGHSQNRGVTPTYVSWAKMFTRCYIPHAKDYKWYGAKGVTVCDRWKDFANFLADMGERTEGLTLDRIDPCGNYEPSNCRWADWQTQRSNRRPIR